MNANATKLAPWVSVYFASIWKASTSAACRIRPSIIAATSDEEHVLSCEYTHTLLRSTCQ